MLVRLIKTYDHHLSTGATLTMVPGQIIDADGDELAELIEAGIAVPHRVELAKERR